MLNKFNYLISKQIVYNTWEESCGPNCITFTINTLLANLTEEDKESIEESITEILQGLGSGNVTFSEFREGPVIVDASPKTLSAQRWLAKLLEKLGISKL